MSSPVPAHVQASTCANGLSEYHLLECGHLVQTPAKSSCHPNCKHAYDRFSCYPEYQLATWRDGMIGCENCTRRKVFLRDILPQLMPHLRQMMVSQGWLQATGATERVGIVDMVCSNSGLQPLWDRNTEAELSGSFHVIGRPLPTAGDDLASILTSVDLGVSDETTAELEMAEYEANKKPVPTKDILPCDIKPLRVGMDRMMDKLNGMDIKKEHESAFFKKVLGAKADRDNKIAKTGKIGKGKKEKGSVAKKLEHAIKREEDKENAA